MVVLVALGLWADGSGKRHILNWEGADKEDQTAWERLVQRLWERGVRLETGSRPLCVMGLKGWSRLWTPFMAQPWSNSGASSTRCAMEVDKCSGLDREGKKLLMDQAAAVSQATSASEARVRLIAFGERWRATQSQAAATF